MAPLQLIRRLSRAVDVGKYKDVNAAVREILAYIVDLRRLATAYHKGSRTAGCNSPKALEKHS